MVIENAQHSQHAVNKMKAANGNGEKDVKAESLQNSEVRLPKLKVLGAGVLKDQVER